MATIEKYIKKNGQITYHFQTKTKNPLNGKIKYFYKTWNNPENLTGVRLEKALRKEVDMWENQVKNAKYLSTQKLTFPVVANEWLNTIKSSKSKLYYLRSNIIVNKFISFFGDIKFEDITPIMVGNFFTNLNNTEYSTVNAVIKPEKASELFDMAKEVGIKKVSREGYFSYPTFYYAKKGEKIAWSSAEAICKRFNIKTSDYFDKISTHNKYRNETKLKYQRVLSAIFNHAIRFEIVTKNYASKQLYLKNYFGEEEKNYSILSRAELDRLIELLNSKPDCEIQYTLPIYLLVTLGLRTCEVCGLNWSDINLEERTIDIKRNRIYIPHEGMVSKITKTKFSIRQLYICDLLYNALIKARKRYEMLKENDPDFSDCGAVHCNHDGTPASSELIAFHLKRYLAEAGCPIISNHKLRHGWITELINNNVPPTVVAKLAGHVNSETTLSVYAHYAKEADHSKDILNKIFA